MSAREAPEESRRRPLLTVLFWAGIGLAPIAALLLLVGQGNGTLRIAAVLAIVVVVLIGLSITLRGDAESARRDMAEILAEELDDLRGELRNDIATAARATHKAFGEKLTAVQGNVEALRGQLDAVRAAADVAPNAAASAPAGRTYGEPSRNDGGPKDPGGPHLGRGVVRHTETVQVTTRQTIVGGHHHDDRAGGGGHNANGHNANGYGANGYGGGTYGGGTYGGGQDRAGYGPADQGGTYSAEPYRGAGSTYGGGGERTTDDRVRDDRPGDDHARADRVRDDRDDRARGPAWGQRSGDPDDGVRNGPRSGDAGWRDRFTSSEPEPETGDPGDDSYWAELRAGDRWTSVRSDDRGREVQIGERRTSMRTDESGTELRVEDRWAAARRAEPRPDGDRRAGRQWSDPRDGAQRADGQYGSGGWSPDGSGAQRAGGHRRDPQDTQGRDPRPVQGWERPGAAPALPAGGVDPASVWGPPGPEPERAGRPRRHRADEEYGYSPLDESPRAGGTRRWEYGYPDESWR